MSLPSGWTLVPVTATYTDNQGSPYTGQVVFVSSQVVTVGGVIVVPKFITATLDDSGSISINLPSTNDPSINPTGWAYQVRELLDGATKDAYNIFVPYDSSGIDLSTVVPVAPPGQLSPYVNGDTLAAVGGASLVGYTSGQNVKQRLDALGTAADTAATDYATAAQGAKADSAVQPSDLAPVATTGTYTDLTGTPTLGTAASQDSTAFATAAQGAKADTAVQTATLSGDASGQGAKIVGYDDAGTATTVDAALTARVKSSALGTAAYSATTDFATSAQGTKADAAMPSATLAASGGSALVGDSGIAGSPTVAQAISTLWGLLNSPYVSVVRPYASLPSFVNFSRSSTATYFGSDGLLHTAAADAPRYEYDPATGLYKGLLIEEQRTNLVLNSAALATQGVSVTAQSYTLSFYGTGSVTLSGAATGTLAGTGASDRVSLTVTPASSGTLTLTVTGSCTNGQLEAGAFPTSYIPTTSATVTRASDVAQITDLSLIGFNTAAGTAYGEASGIPSEAGGRAILGGLGNATNTLLYVLNGSAIQPYVTGQGVTPLHGFTPGGRVSTATAWDASGMSYAEASSGIASSTSTFSGVDLGQGLRIGAFKSSGWAPLNGHIKELRYYPRRLSDAELQAVTA